MEDCDYKILTKEETAPVLVLSPDYSYEVIEKKWSRSHRGDIRRQKKRISELGKTKFVVESSKDEIKKYFSHFYSLYSQKWGGEDKSSEKFFFDLALNHRLSVFSYYSVNGSPVAYHLGFKSKKKFYYYMPGFEGEFQNYSPGKILTSLLLEKACEDKIPYFDFLLGSEPYKYNWGVSDRKVTSFYLPVSLKGKFICWWLSTGKETVRKRIKKR